MECYFWFVYGLPYPGGVGASEVRSVVRITYWSEVLKPVALYGSSAHHYEKIIKNQAPKVSLKISGIKRHGFGRKCNNTSGIVVLCSSDIGRIAPGNNVKGAVISSDYSALSNFLLNMRL